jgi:hypothetical protein
MSEAPECCDPRIGCELVPVSALGQRARYMVLDIDGPPASG